MSSRKTIPIQPVGEEEPTPYSTPCEGSEPYVLMVLGDSMEPEFEEGEVIVIEPDGVVEDGSYVVAYHDDEYIFRQLIQRDGRWFLHPLNERYPTVEVDGIDVAKGVVTQKKRPGRRDSHKRYV